MKAEVKNVRFDSTLAIFVAEVGIINLGSAIGRDVALVLPGLPAEVTLSNASGISSNGVAFAEKDHFELSIVPFWLSDKHWLPLRFRSSVQCGLS